MKTVTLSGHVEGESIRLDDPYKIPAGAKLLITVLPPESFDSERADWLALSEQGLARAYSDDEPGYPLPGLK